MRSLALATTLLAALSLADLPPSWPTSLPALCLADPLGQQFTDTALTRQGAVVIATAPSLAQGSAQNAWDEAFQGAKRSPGGPVLVMLEDMSQSWFRKVVLARMKDEYRPGQGTVLLLDESGATRKALGVADNATVAFAFAPGGKLVAVETATGSVERAEKLLRAASR